MVQEVVAQSRARDPKQWAGFAGCQAVEIYTDGSAPVRNPGGPAGFAAVVVGFATVAPGAEERPPAIARLDLGGFVPARETPPATTNNRVEIAGIMAAWAALPHLAPGPWTRATLRIWSDSDYAVSCGNGTYKRKKNTDLWPIYDGLAVTARAGLDCEARVLWVKGHAGNLYNAAADELATQAAFNFDVAAYQTYRAAQAATGLEMPRLPALRGTAAGQADAALAPRGAERNEATTHWPLPAAWHTDTDYAVAVHTGAAVVGGGSSGVYRVANKHGRAQDMALPPLHGSGVDAIAYAALVHALTDLSARITNSRSQTQRFTVTVFTCQQVVARQLSGGYRVLSPEMQGPHAEARKLIDGFARVEIVYKPAPEIKRLFAERP